VIARPPTRAMPYLVVGGVCVGVLLARVAWASEAVHTAPDWIAVADDWLVRVGVGLALGIPAWPKVRGWLGLDTDERRHAEAPDQQPITRAELRQAITDAVQTVRAEIDGLQAEGAGQHRRVGERIAALERQIAQTDGRLTTWLHDTASHREGLARELGQIGADVSGLRRHLEHKP